MRRAAALLLLAVLIPACDDGDDAAVASAVLVDVLPASPSTNQLPTFRGTAHPGALVELFTNAAGTGSPVASGTATSSGTFQITVSVPRPSQRIYYAFSTPARAPRTGPSNGLTYASRTGGVDTPVPYAVGTQPLHLAAGLFNADANLDLAVTNASTGDVSLLFGNGDGTFAAGSPLAVSSPRDVAVADFNGDQFADLAVTSAGTNSVAILLGDGLGGFGAPASVAVGASPFGIVAGDLDGDGVADLAVANTAGNDVSILRGQNDGTFVAMAGSPVAVGSGPLALALADVNGGLPDLLVPCRNSSSIHVLLNAGSGTFALAPGGAVPSTDPWWVAAADVDGDGRTDLAAVGLTPDTLATYLGDGAGGFAATVPPTHAAGSNPIVLQVGDLNGDGRLDFAVSNNSSNTLSLFGGDGAGGFAPAVPLAAGNGPRGFLAVDLNGDGAPDLAVVNQFANTVDIFLAK